MDDTQESEFTNLSLSKFFADPGWSNLMIRLRDDYGPHIFFKNKHLMLLQIKSRPVLDVGKYQTEWNFDNLTKVTKWEGKTCIYCEFMYGDCEPNFEVTRLALIAHYGTTEPKNSFPGYGRGMYGAWVDDKGNFVNDPRPPFPRDRGVTWIAKQFPNLKVLRLRMITSRFYPSQQMDCPNRFSMETFGYSSILNILNTLPNLKKLEIEILKKEGETKSSYDAYPYYKIVTMEIMTPRRFASMIQRFKTFLMGTKCPNSPVSSLPKDILKLIYKLYQEDVFTLKGFEKFSKWEADETGQIIRRTPNGKDYMVCFQTRGS